MPPPTPPGDPAHAPSSGPQRDWARGPVYSESAYTLSEFEREFPDDDACLRWLWRNRCSEDGSYAYCPQCERRRRFARVADRPAWDCHHCGYHLHPLAGTVFHKSSTSLCLWFRAAHLLTSTRCRMSARQLERELGVTYKTAWRMLTLIRGEFMVGDDLAGFTTSATTVAASPPLPSDSGPALAPVAPRDGP